MKKIVAIWLSIAVAFGLAACSGEKAQEPDRLLVFTKTAGWRHKSIEAGVEAIRKLGQENGFEIVHTEETDLFIETELARFQAVMFLNTTGDVLNDAEQQSFERYIQAGGGFVGVHSAADTEWQKNDWHWFTRLVGGAFISHPKQQDATILVKDASDASTKHLPSEWRVWDEWYNYQRTNPNVEVLLALDETSYDPGDNAMGEHPIAWKHDFDGGRAFYTGRGHTDESYLEPEFLAHLLGGIRYAMGPEGHVLDFAGASPEDWRLEREVKVTGVGEPVAMAFTPSGELYIADRKGRLRWYDPDNGTTDVVAKFGDIFFENEFAFGGIAFDPNYSENNLVYVYYTVIKEDRPTHRLVRYAMKDRKLDHDSRIIMLEVPAEAGSNHEGGDIEFDRHGNLWLSTGDNTNPFESDGHSPHDDGEGRTIFDARRSAANTMDLRGKVLRITPQVDGSYTIPEGNLFDDAATGRPEIYAMGLRNPYRIALDQRTDTLYWGEVGPDARADNPLRGPRGYDEFNRTTKPGFFGWPLVISHQYAYGDHDFQAGETGEKFSLTAPKNDSRFNTGATDLPPAQEAWIGYPYNLDDRWYELTDGIGSGGRTAIVGEVYYYDDYPEGPGKFPRWYDGKLFISEFIRRWIKAVDMTENGTILRIEPVMQDEKFVAPIDLKFAPDGTLWVLEYGSIWFADNIDSQLTQITYNSAKNPPPVAAIEVDKRLGAAPFTVNADASGSYDRNRDDSLNYEWYLASNGGDSVLVGKGVALTHEIAATGTHTLTAVAIDTAGNRSEASQQLVVGNDLPEIKVELSGPAGFFREGKSIPYKVSVSDAEDGSTADGYIDASSVSVKLDWIPGGKDQVEAAMGHQQVVDDLHPGEILANASDCMGCHHKTEQSAGPSLFAIATRYAGVEGADSTLADKVINGGGGVWGDQAMPAHTDTSKDDAGNMVAWILGMAGEGDAAPSQGLPLEGELVFDQHQGDLKTTMMFGEALDGVYVLSVRYTDHGGDNAPPVTVEHKTIFRYETLQAATANLLKGVQSVTPDVKDNAESDTYHGSVLLVRDSLGHVMYRGINFDGLSKLEMRVFAQSAAFAGGRIGLRLGSPEGEQIGEIAVDPVPGIGVAVVSADLSAVEGTHDLYLVFDKPADTEAAHELLMAITWLKFSE